MNAGRDRLKPDPIVRCLALLGHASLAASPDIAFGDAAERLINQGQVAAVELAVAELSRELVEKGRPLLCTPLLGPRLGRRRTRFGGHRRLRGKVMRRLYESLGDELALPFRGAVCTVLQPLESPCEQGWMVRHRLRPRWWCSSPVQSVGLPT